MPDKPTSGFIAILAGVATVAGPFLFRVPRKDKHGVDVVSESLLFGRL
jgi:hypothetical protein